MQDQADRLDTGIQLIATGDGTRSSTRAGKAIFAEAVRAVDAQLAADIESASDWRKRYMDHVARVVAAGVPRGKDALRIAADGLAAAHRHVSFSRNGPEMSISDAFESFDAQRFDTSSVDGHGSHPGQLQVPYRGRLLSGDSLLEQLDAWTTRGVLEPSCRDALALVVKNPSWLHLNGHRFALIGAASEMGPLQPLSAWGADILAVDLPRPHLWEHIFEAARNGSGRLFAPVRSDAIAAEDDAMRAGADLLTEAPEIATWLSGFEGPMSVGNYVYADGSTFVRLAVVTDALIGKLLTGKRNLSIAYLATPTDVFAVRQETVEGARARTKARFGSIIGPLTRSKLYSPNYKEFIDSEDGRRWGVSDALVPIQGPNYALAKSLQRWRAILAREEGSLSSANVAPASLTRSVVKNKLLAAAYRGAPSFGIEIFESETTRWLMGALLVHDLRNPSAAARPDAPLEHPYDLFCDAALHGGIWRLGHTARSILPLGLAVGLVKRS